MNIHLRNAQSGDAKDIQNVFYESWLLTYPNEKIGITEADIQKLFEGKFTPDAIADYAKRLEATSVDKVFLVAVDTEVNKVVGLCRLTLRDEYNQLQAIYILPPYQSKGIGTMLWDEAQKYFVDNKDIVVDVAMHNAQAIAFYTKLGFVDTGKRFEEERHRMPISGVTIPEMQMILKK